MTNATHCHPDVHSKSHPKIRSTQPTQFIGAVDNPLWDTTTMRRFVRSI